MKISTKQLLVLDYIKQFIASKGYSPTVREITAGLGLKSPSTVQEHIKKLMTSGIITLNPTKSRTIELLVENEYLIEDETVVKVPIITEEYLDSFSKEFIEIPKFMLNGYDSKHILAYRESSNKIYLLNKSIKPNSTDLVLIFDTKLKIDKIENTEDIKIIGTIISKFEIL